MNAKKQVISCEYETYFFLFLIRNKIVKYAVTTAMCGIDPTDTFRTPTFDDWASGSSASSVSGYKVVHDQGSLIKNETAICLRNPMGNMMEL